MESSSSTPFGDQDYAEQLEWSREAADAVVPFVFGVLGEPSRVVDFGCGAGTWLAAMRSAGAEELLGVESGTPDPNQLQIPADILVSADLERPLDLGRRFDLALCIEVAEHLPPAAESTLIDTLTRHSDVVLFSAAIPGQGGQHHLNENWPSHWAAHFAARGFDCFDVLRPTIWNNDAVEYWYRQNLLVFATGDPAARLRDRGNRPRTPLDLVHPLLLERYRKDPPIHGVRREASHLLTAIKRKLSALVRG